MFGIAPAFFKAGSASVPTVPEAVSIYNALVSWWDFDGNRNDATANANNMTGGAAPTFVTGKIGQAAQTPNISSSTKVGANATLTGTSLFGWIFMSNVGTSLAVAAYAQVGVSASESLGLSHLTGTGFQGFHRNASGTVTQVNVGTVASSGTWYHLAIVCNGSTVQLYVNNVSIGTATIATPTDRATNGFQIGSAFSSTNAPGNVDMWGFVNKALTSGEVAYLYNSGVGRAYATLKTDSGH